ncbi:MAG: hypothetical protein ABIL58_24080 [Pseudomonadota bacterium]
MKHYVIDELNRDDIGKLKPYLEAHLHRPTVAGIYWLFLDTEHLSSAQLAHPDCGAFYFAVELEAHRLVCELLVRSEKRIRCECIQYADPEQCLWVIGVIDAILEKLEINA